MEMKDLPLLEGQAYPEPSTARRAAQKNFGMSALKIQADREAAEGSWLTVMKT